MKLKRPAAWLVFFYVYNKAINTSTYGIILTTMEMTA